MKVVILTPQNKLYEEEAREIFLPGEDGDFSVLDFHQDCLYRLRKGAVKVYGQSPIRVIIKNGIAKIRSNQLTVLAEV